VNLMLDKFTGKSRGFAFVEYSTAEEANKRWKCFTARNPGPSTDRQHRATSRRAPASFGAAAAAVVVVSAAAATAAVVSATDRIPWNIGSAAGCRRPVFCSRQLQKFRRARQDRRFGVLDQAPKGAPVDALAPADWARG